MEPKAPPARSGKPRRVVKWLVGGFAFLVVGFLLCGVGLYVAERNAGVFLDAKQRECQAEADELRASVAEPREVLVEEIVQEGNAVDYYLAVQLLLAGADTSTLPLAEWQRFPPNWPWDLERVRSEVVTTEADPDADLSLLLYGIDPETAAPDEFQFQRAVREYQRLRPALNYVRRGVRQARCDWEYMFESGVDDASGRSPGIEAAQVANLLAYEASTQEPREGLETGLTILAYGRDVERHASLFAFMLGSLIRHLGLQSIAHSFGRPGLSRDDYVWAREVLSSFEVGDPSYALKGERICNQVEILKIARRPMRGVQLAKPGPPTSAIHRVLEWDIARAHLWGDYEAYFARMIELSKLPRAEAEAEFEALMAELKSSDLHILTRIFVISLIGKLEERAKLEQGHRILRVLAEAHLRRLETGSFPSEEPIPPGEDPSVARPWSYSIEEGRAYCRPVTFDGVGGRPIVGEGSFLSTGAPK